MTLREFIMSVLCSLLISSLFMLNIETIIIGQKLGVGLANIMGVDSNFQIGMMSAGITYDIIFILIFSLTIVETFLLPQIFEALGEFNEWLWNKFKY